MQSSHLITTLFFIPALTLFPSLCFAPAVFLSPLDSTFFFLPRPPSLLAELSVQWGEGALSRLPQQRQEEES